MTITDDPAPEPGCRYAGPGCTGPARACAGCLRTFCGRHRAAPDSCADCAARRRAEEAPRVRLRPARAAARIAQIRIPEKRTP